MNLLLAILLAQAPLDATIDAFVKGDKDTEAAAHPACEQVFGHHDRQVK